MVRLVVVGCGYVGAVTAACLAELGHRVLGIDIDEGRVRALQRGSSPVYEPGLEPLIQGGLASGRLSFSSSYFESIDAEIVFITVNTPASQEGAADLRAVRDVVTALGPRLAPGTILVNKSMVPIGTGELVEGMAARSGARDVSVVSNPEFLREGSAVHDFLHPERVVLGSNDPAAAQRVSRLYEPLGAPIQCVDIRTAEMIKYASNAFLATKISFINEIANICESLGADVLEVARGMGTDSRIGERYLQPGLGWGGSCFPKDVRALALMAAVHGAHPQLLRSVMDINAGQRLRTVQKVREGLGGLERRRVLVLGGTFKPDTDDVRNSPALEVASLLEVEGACVAVYDPVLKRRPVGPIDNIEVVGSILDGARGADAVVLGTDWPEFQAIDFVRLARAMRGDLIVDARDCLDPVVVHAAGLRYRCLGRPAAELDTPPVSNGKKSPEALRPSRTVRHREKHARR